MGLVLNALGIHARLEGHLRLWTGHLDDENNLYHEILPSYN
jgi:hypothetical protein